MIRFHLPMIRSTCRRDYSGLLEVVAIPSLYFGYVVTTHRENCITISRKYISNSGGIFMNYVVVDSYDNHYHMNNCIWYPKWSYIEHWNHIQAGDKLHIQCYGHRNRIVDLYPNIVNIGRPDAQKYDGKDVNIML